MGIIRTLMGQKGQRVSVKELLKIRHIVSMLGVAAFPVVRHLHFGPGFTNGLETSALAAALFLWASSNKRRNTWAASWAALWFYMKAVVVALAFVDDKLICVAFTLAYLLQFGIISLLPSTVHSYRPSFVRIMNNETFFTTAYGRPRARMEKALEKAGDPRKIKGNPEGKTVVMHVTAPWSPIARDSVDLFREMCSDAKDINPALVCASLDVSRWKEIAAFLNINTAGSSLQVPSMLVFRGGQEVARFPPIYSTEGQTSFGIKRKLPKDMVMTRDNVTRAFFDYVKFDKDSNKVKTE